MAHTLFQKKSKQSLRKINIEDIGYPMDFRHTRSFSTSSTISTTSSTVSHSKPHAYDPLSLHPPLSFNTSPVIEEDESEVHHEHRQLSDSDYDDAESPLNYYFNNNNHSNNADHQRRSYDQTAQWPLKDWQPIPPALADVDEEQHTGQGTSRTSSSASSQRRPPKETLNQLNEFVQRGDWKRRGIVFGLDELALQEQARHFEVDPF